MALADLEFKVYEDAALTTEFGGVLSVSHQGDLSDGDQDFVLYLGSSGSATQLQTTVNPGVDDVTITPTDTLPEWVASTAFALNYSAEPTAGNGRRYIVTTAGTSAATEPTWPTAIGSSVTDGSIVWTCIAETHETSEFKIASTLVGLDSAIAAAGLALGHTLSPGSANAKQLHIRITNAVSSVHDESVQREIGFHINDVTETAA